MPSHEHKFAVHNYKKPTYCKYCDNMLLGLIKQGLRCKRCNVDIHSKCKDDYIRPCIEIVVGHHNFQEKNYHQPAYCDYCTKLLVGITKQGLRCSECGANVHLKCEEKIEPLCENTKLLGRKLLSPSKSATSRLKSRSNESLNISGTDTDSRQKSPRKVKKGEQKKQWSSDEDIESRISINIERPQSAEEVIQPTHSAAVFDRMPPAARRKSDTPKYTKKKSSNVQALNEQVHEVEQIVKTNIEELQNRQERLETLEDRAEQINANSRQFEMQSKKIERKFFLQNKRCIIAIVTAVVLMIIIIILAVVIKGVM